MNRTKSAIARIIMLSLAVCGADAVGQYSAPTAVNFQAKDGLRIHGDIFLAKSGKQAPLIMLFHQAGGDARGEYGPIVPRLLQQGYNVLEIDQRNGGSQFGNTNRTVATLDGKEFSYCDAYQDLEAALKYAKDAGFTGKRFAWGSSYSAALVIQLGAKHPKDLAGILAFSPASGEVMGNCKPEPFIADLKIPLIAFRPASEMTSTSVQDQMELFRAHGVQTFVADPGVHGSSMLVPERAGGNTEKQWNAALNFIGSTLKKPDTN